MKGNGSSSGEGGKVSTSVMRGRRGNDGGSKDRVSSIEVIWEGNLIRKLLSATVMFVLMQIWIWICCAFIFLCSGSFAVCTYNRVIFSSTLEHACYSHTDYELVPEKQLTVPHIYLSVCLPCLL
jgi:hypothetical protein